MISDRVEDIQGEVKSEERPAGLVGLLNLVVIGLASVVLFPGCGEEPRLRGSSPDSLMASYDRMRRTAPTNQRRGLDTALIEILSSPAIWDDEGVDTLALDSLRQLAMNFASDSTRSRLAGRSIDDLFVLQDSAYLEYLHYATDRLDSIREQAPKDSIALSQIQVLETDFRQRRASIAGIIANGRVKIRNKLDTAVLGFDFHASLKEPGRSIPYAESEVVVITIPGGIEPGEARWMDFMFSDPVWSRDIYPNNAKLTITPTNIYLEDLEPYLSSPAGAAEFDVRDSLRLDSLRHVLDTFTVSSGADR